MKTKIVLLCLLMTMLYAGFLTNAADAAIGSSGTAVLNITLVSQNPDPATAGETVELKFMVENKGGQATDDLQFELLLQYPFMEIPGEEYNKTVKALGAYQQGADSPTVKYKVRVDKDAVKGTNEIKLKRSEEGSDTSIIETFDVEVTGSEYAQIIYVDKSILNPGEETPLKFTITNVGTSPLQNLVFSWNEENGVILPVYSDDTKYIKYIDVGKSVDLEYTVVADVNTDPGLYQLDLTLKFEAQSGVSQEMNTKAGIFVGGETDFDVTFSESSAGQTSLSVANTGNNQALSVTVRIPEQNNFAVSGSTSSIIGNLDKGDYTIVSFQISQAGAMTGIMGGRMNRTNLTQIPASPQNNNLKVLIEYTDTTGKRHALEKSVPIQFRSSDSTTTGQTSTGYRQQNNILVTYLPYIIIVVVIVVGIVCYKKRKSLRNHFGRHSSKDKA
jgi:hypothetical protein